MDSSLILLPSLPPSVPYLPSSYTELMSTDYELNITPSNKYCIFLVAGVHYKMKSLFCGTKIFYDLINFKAFSLGMVSC